MAGNTPSARTRPSVLAAATLSASSTGRVAPGTAAARRRAVAVPTPTMTASRPTTTSRLSESKMAWIT